MNNISSDDVQKWDAYHQKVFKPNEVHSHYAEEVEKNIPRGSLIVEMGAGTGADALFFLKKGHGVIALDISPFALKKLEEKAENANLTKKLVTRQVDFGLHNIPVKDASVNVVYSRISLNYFGSKQTTKIFGDIYRVLKPGGRAYLTFKSPDDLMEMEYLTKNATEYEPNVFIEGGVLRSRFTTDQLSQMLVNANIPNFEVKPLREDLGKKGEGHYPILYVNEVTFTKV